MKSKFLFLSSILLLTSFLLSTNISAQQPITVGIPKHSMELFFANQDNSQWCWAAAIQMVLNGYGVSIEQEQIVKRTYGTDPYGNLPNWPGSFQAIHNNLNNWGIDNKGNPYTVRASIGMGAPSPAVLIQELSSGRPVIIGYKSGPNSGHAVLITALSYVQTWNGPIIQTIVVRDPWPSKKNIQNNGLVVYPAAALANQIQAYWFVRVHQ